jgi:hypothetical protein
LPEETPVSEVIDTAYQIEDKAGVALGPVVVNQCFTPLPAGVKADVPSILADAEACERFVSGREATDLSRAAEFRAERHDLQHEQIERLRTRLALPQIELPFVFSPDITRAQLEVLADALTRGIEQL